MTLRRGVLCCLLVYVTLDLSLPAMPGAFVFEPADSVESVHPGRGRPTSDAVPLPAPLPGAWLTIPSRPAVVERPGPARATHPAAAGVVSRLPRAALASTSALEDPH